MSDELELQPATGDAPVTAGNQPVPLPVPAAEPIGGPAPLRETPARPAGPIGAPELPPEPVATALAIEELDVAGIIAQTFKLVQRRFVTLLGISAAITIPAKLCFLLFIGIAALLPAFVPASASGGATLLGVLALVGIAVVVYALITLAFVLPLVSGATIHTIACEYLGVPVENSGALQSISASFRRLLPLIGTALLGTVLTLFGYCLLIVPGIYLTICFWFAACCVVLENRSGWSALKRSRELMAGNFGTAIVLGIVTMVAQGTLDKTAERVPIEALQWIGSTLADLFVNLCVAAATVVFYFSCRFKLEGFDVAALRKGMGMEEDAVTNPESEPA